MQNFEGLDATRRANAQLTDGQVRTIRRLHRQGHPAKDLAKVYQVGTETIRRILRRETWSYLPDEAPLATLPPLSEAEKAKVQESQDRLLAELSGGPKAGELELSSEALERLRTIGQEPI